MRERIYITTCPNTDIWTDSYCKKESTKYKNVMMYSEQNKGIYLNGVRYGSLNQLSDLTNGILFSMSTDEFNVIRLSQEEFPTSGVRFYYRGKEIYKGHVIQCHVGERIQILSDVPTNFYNNNQYFWVSTNNNVATIDRNNIITPILASDEKESINLMNFNDNSILFTIKLKIYKANAPFENSPYVNSADAINAIISHDYGDVTMNEFIDAEAIPRSSNITGRSLGIDDNQNEELQSDNTHVINNERP